MLRTLAVIAVLAAAIPAFAAQRTFVASTGSDSHSCSLSAPCRGFATAIGHTDPGGEIVVLDSAGYGPVVIGKSIAIIAPAGVYAGITVFSGDGILVDGPNIVVSLRGLAISGLGGATGIRFTQGKRLTIEHVTVSGMAAEGILATAAGALHVADSVTSNNGTLGISISGPVIGSIIRVRASGNGSDGIDIKDGASVAIADTVVSENAFAGVVVWNTVASTTQASIDRLQATSNAASGVLVNSNTASADVKLSVTRSNVSQNLSHGFGVCCTSGLGTLTVSLDNSLVAGNSQRGIPFQAAAGWALTLSANRIIDNVLDGIKNFGGTVLTRQENTLSGNNGGGPQVSGALTPLGGT